jgi:hypothetical protein
MHIYRELNNFVDTLSKETISLPENHLVMKEFSTGELVSIRDNDHLQM